MSDLQSYWYIKPSSTGKQYVLRHYYETENFIAHYGAGASVSYERRVYQYDHKLQNLGINLEEAKIRTLARAKRYSYDGEIKVYDEPVSGDYKDKTKQDHSVFHFGKYKDKSIVDIMKDDPHYIEWLLGSTYEGHATHEMKKNLKFIKDIIGEESYHEIETRREREVARRQVDKEAREKGWADEKEIAKAKSQWVGKIGDRIKAIVIVDVVIHTEKKQFGSYGSTLVIYKLSDAKGNIFTWFTYGLLDLGKRQLLKMTKEDLETYNSMKGVARKGDVIEIAGTVKKHSEYEGAKQTILNRVSLVRFITKK